MLRVLSLGVFHRLVPALLVSLASGCEDDPAAPSGATGDAGSQGGEQANGSAPSTQPASGMGSGAGSTGGSDSSGSAPSSGAGGTGDPGAVGEQGAEQGGAEQGGAEQGGAEQGGAEQGAGGSDAAGEAGAGPASGDASAGQDAAGGAEADPPAGSGGAGGASPDAEAAGGAASIAEDAGVPGNDGSGLATPETCSFEIAGEPSALIPTVGVVDWATDLPGLSEARIEFSLDDPEEGELNVAGGGAISVSEPSALMLGLKPARSYTYRIIARAGETECVSEDHSLSTGRDPAAPSLMQVTGPAFAERAGGFIVVCAYRSTSALILDTDGEVVWRASAPSSCSRAHLDWSGEYLWMMAANASTGASAGGSSGDVRRVRMDGSAEEAIPDLEGSHHDFAILPDGTTAFLSVTQDGTTEVLERAPDGSFRSVLRLDEDAYLVNRGNYHPNALRYYPQDESYTVSDLQVPGIIKFDRQGQVSWRAGSCGSAAPSQCASADLGGTHGHHLLANGNLLFFRANYGTGNLSDPSPVDEYSFSLEGGALSASPAWSFVGEWSSLILGDVERLPNGNTLVTYSTDGTIAEVSPAGDVVQSLSGPNSTQFGYSRYRESLYAPPQ